MSPRPGRRPGPNRTRAQILAAARASFAQNGYDRATIRDVARRAGVDPALVHHYFDNKRKLFLATVEAPVDPAAIVAGILHARDGSIGQRIARTFLRAWDGPQARTPMVALLRSAASDPEAARIMREFVTTEVLGRITAALRVPDAQLRAALVGSHLVGVALMRYVIRLEPMASMPPDDLADAIAPALEHYLTGEVSAATPGEAEGMRLPDP